MKRKFFRCAKGAVSLFLIVLLLPFTQIATILVSAQRYNSSIALLDEIMDSSAISTLSDYDRYVRDRFGLFTFNQKNDLENSFKSYFDYNKNGLLKNAFGESLTISAKGGLKLSDDDILLTQIKEYNKLNAPFKMIHDGLDLSELIKKFEKSFNLSNILDLCNAGVDFCDGALDFNESYEKLVNLSDSINSLKGTYDSTFNEFSDAISNIYDKRDEIEKIESTANNLNTDLEDLNKELEKLNEKLNKSGTSEKEKKTIQKEIDELNKKIEEKKDEIKTNQEENSEKNDEYQSLINTFNSKKTAYVNSHTDLISKLSSYKSEMKTALDKIDSMINSTTEVLTSAGNVIAEGNANNGKKSNDELKKELEQYDGDNAKDKDSRYYEIVFEMADNDGESAKFDMVKGTNDGFQKLVSEVSEKNKDAKEKFDEAAIQNTIDNLSSQKNTVDALTVSDIKNTQNGNQYHTSVDIVMNRNELKRLYDYFEDASNDIGVSLEDIWEGVKSFFESIFKVKLVYDPALCSKIDSSYFAEQFGITIDNPATNPVAAFIQTVSDFVTGFIDFVSGVGSFDFIKAFEGIKKVFKGVINMFSSLINVITQLISNVAQYISDPSKMLLPYYFTQTLPCRTDYDSGSNMTGVPYSNIEYSKSGETTFNGLPVIESVVSLFNLVTGEKEANDKMFCGAELEYLIAGGSSEIANQSTVFGMLYVLRMLLDIPGWGKATELQALASGPHYPIVLAIYILLEPFLDCVLLVNGSEVGLLKSTPYLSVAGMADFIPKIMTIVPKDSTTTAKMKDKFSRIFVKAGEKLDGADYSYDKESVVSGSGEAKKNGFTEYFKNLFNFTYKEYLMLLMLLWSNHSAELSLFKNLIQMETQAYNSANDKGDFDLRKAYTQINCTASGSATPLLSLAFNDSIFKFTRQQCRGY